MTLIIFLYIFLVGIIPISEASGTIRFEFENVVGGPGFQRSPWRSMASEVSSLHMYEGDKVHLDLCVSQVTTVRLNKFVYSNDGASDTIRVRMVDGQQLGTIRTEETFNGWGHHWNSFKSTAGNSTVTLDNAKQTMEIKVLSADCYGTEIDSVEIITDTVVNSETFFCGFRFIKSAIRSPCAQDNDATTVTTSNTTSASATTATSSSTASTPTTTSKSSVSTTSTTQKTTTPGERDENKNRLVKQLSYSNDCLSNKNVRLLFTPLSLKGVTIIARSNSVRDVKFTNRFNADEVIDVCRNRIWQIGKFNTDHSDLGPLRFNNIDYSVTEEKDTQMPFPGLINPQFTRTVTIRYYVPGDISLGQKGTAYLTLGLVNVTSDVIVGAQYHIRRKKNPSKIEYVTLTPEQSVVGWDIPARAISPSLENVITLHFNMAAPTPLRVDFLRLESLGEKYKSKKQIIARGKSWKVRAFIYKTRRNKMKKDGMTVSVDGGNKEDSVEKVVLFRKPFKKTLTIYQDGKIFPYHHIKPTEDEKTNASMLTDTSGLTFGNPNMEISTVDLYTTQNMAYANIVYKNRNFIRLSVNYTAFRTKIQVLETSISKPKIRFFSTYITDYVTAVNEVVINNNKHFDIRNKRINKTKGQRYTFLKTTPNKMFKVNDEYEFVFPRNVIPSNIIR